MPFNIPASGLGGSIPLTDPATSATGSFPNLWKPDNAADWTITVPLSTDSECPVNALIELIQYGDDNKITVITSQSFSITSTPTNCVLTISNTADILKGACSISRLAVRVTPTEECYGPCCDGANLPDELVADDGAGETVTLTRVTGTNQWSGSAPMGFVGCYPAVVTFTCNNNDWTFYHPYGFFCHGAATRCAPFLFMCHQTGGSGCLPNIYYLTISG